MRQLTTMAMVCAGLALHAEWTMAPDALVITPASGTMFESSLTISMSCSIDGTVIHYTLDGKDPTIDSPVYKKFKISGKTTVKAAPFCDMRKVPSATGSPPFRNRADFCPSVSSARNISGSTR